MDMHWHVARAEWCAKVGGVCCTVLINGMILAAHCHVEGPRVLLVGDSMELVSHSDAKASHFHLIGRTDGKDACQLRRRL